MPIHRCPSRRRRPTRSRLCVPDSPPSRARQAGGDTATTERTAAAGSAPPHRKGRLLLGGGEPRLLEQFLPREKVVEFGVELTEPYVVGRCLSHGFVQRGDTLIDLHQLALDAGHFLAGA